MIYLDNAATTKPYPQVLRAMSEAPWGNSNSIHKLGLEAKKAITRVEDQVRKAIGASGGQILWSNGGSSANSFICSEFNVYMGGTEHKSMYTSNPKIPVWANGEVSFAEIQALRRAMQQRPGHYVSTNPEIFSAMMVNNETGIINPIEPGIAMCIGIPVHSDCVQALGKLPINVEKMGVDAVTLSAHKIHGPKGIGCLWLSDRLARSSTSDPSGNNFQSTYNIPGIMGFGAALELMDIGRHQRIVGQLNEAFQDTLKREAPGYIINSGSAGTRVPSILNLRWQGIDAFQLMMDLSDKEIYISLGSACNSKEIKPSHVLKAMGLSDEQANSSIRISFSEDNTIEEVIFAAREIASLVRNQQQIGLFK